MGLGRVSRYLSLVVRIRDVPCRGLFLACSRVASRDKTVAMCLQVSFYSPCSPLPSQALDGWRTSADYTHVIDKLVSLDEGPTNEFGARPRKGLTVHCTSALSFPRAFDVPVPSRSLGWLGMAGWLVCGRGREHGQGRGLRRATSVVMVDASSASVQLVICCVQELGSRMSRHTYTHAGVRIEHLAAGVLE
ncbi:hypothetical protein K466DRAFT_373042 [Polyporus arcularius HHB13444]|uniref:Uncharacterized protein n=1 Tax=Polyporus arcularius HHB13444 TaxID=1314778 RepID=A0A5C3P496_9APHY|nr:hypothetical protein K466DRAFT_373042 [Polyporus arcularius HHB13444]